MMSVATTTVGMSTKEDMMSPVEMIAAESVELTEDESRAEMDALIMDRLHISREEFLENLDRGVYAGIEDNATLHLITLAPFAR